MLRAVLATFCTLTWSVAGLATATGSAALSSVTMGTTGAAGATAASRPEVAGTAGVVDAVDAVDAVGADGAGLRVELTTMTPRVGSPGSGVALTGRIVQVSGATAPTSSLVRVWRGPSAVTRDRVADWSQTTTAPSGNPIASTTAAGGTFTLTIDRSVLDAAARSSLGSRALGAIPLALVATPSGFDPSAATVAEPVALHTFLPWQSRKEYQPITLGFLAPITVGSDPRLFATDPAVRANAWTAQLAPTSPLSRMVRATADEPVTWAIDPVLLDPAGAGVVATGSTGTTETTGPTLAPPTGSAGSPSSSPATASPTTTSPTMASPSTGPGNPGPAPGGPDEFAIRSDFASTLAATIADPNRPKPALALPWGDPDVAAFADLDPDNSAAHALVTRAAPLAARLGRTAAEVPTIAWPADGSLAGARADHLARLWGSTGPALTFAAASSAVGDPNVTESRTTGVRTSTGAALLWDDRLSATVTGTGTGTELTAQFLADTAAIVNERPGIAGRSFLVAIPRDSAVDPAAIHELFSGIGQAPWLGVAAPATLTAPADAAAIATTTPSWTAGGRTMLTEQVIGDLDRQHTTAQQVASLLSDIPAITATWNEAINEVGSTRWRTDPSGFDAMTASSATIADDLTAGISVAPGTTNFLADDGMLTVTVVNDLDVPLTGARLRLQPLDPRMRIDGDPGSIDIGAHSKATVRVHAIAVAAGLVAIDATVTTANGTPVGRSAELTIRANPPGSWPYVAAGVLSGLILVAGIARTIRNRRRRHIPGLD